MSLIWRGGIPRSGIRSPGLIACGLRIQRASHDGVFGIVFEASVERVARWVSAGPMNPWAWVPAMRWQLAHWSFMKSALPRVAAAPVGVTAGRSWFESQALNFAIGSA